MAELLSTEVDDRAERRRLRRIREARFPRLKHLADFDTSISPVDPATIATLTAGTFIDTGSPVVLLGDSGTGKTHLLIGAGIAACHTGRSVRYVTAASLVNELVEAQDERTLTRTVGRYGRLDLLLIDELGYLHLDPRGAELLFQVITEREERASVAVGTNVPSNKSFSKSRASSRPTAVERRERMPLRRRGCAAPADHQARHLQVAQMANPRLVNELMVPSKNAADNDDFDIDQRPREIPGVGFPVITGNLLS